MSPRSLMFSIAAAAGLALSAAAPLALGATPAASEQVAGYYHHRLGSVQVTALFDGAFPLPRSWLNGIDPALAASLNQRDFVPGDAATLQTAINAYLIDDGVQLTLIDAGTADCFGPGLGQIPAQLQAAGYAADDVDQVLLTHAHPDHLCGVLDAAGKPRYPQATLWLAAADADYWLSPSAEASAPEVLRSAFGQARRAVDAYAKHGRVKRFTAADTLPAGIVLVASPGHTPGHSSYLIDGGGAGKLLVWGDIVHYHAVQFAHPDAAFEPDSDRPAAIASRKRLLQQAASQAWWVAGAHLPFPGIGHVRVEDGAYAWVPLEYAPLPPR